MRPIKLASDNLVELLGPVNAALDEPVTTGTCVARLFYDRVDTALRVAVASGAVLQVDHTRRWTVGMHALVWLDTAAWHDGGAVAAVDNDARTITITNAIPSNCKVGNRVSSVPGTGTQHQINMSYFAQSTPVVGREDYGFRGTIPYAQPGLVIGQAIRIEIDLNVTSGVRTTEVIRTVVAGGT